MSSSNQKFGRNFLLTVTGQDFIQPLVLTTPFTIEFDCHRDTYASTNHAILRIFNLSKAHRSLLLKDQYTYFPTIQVVFQAGYGSGPNYPIVFAGNVTRGYSVREGTNFVTTLELFDGGDAYQNATTSRAWPRNTPLQQVYSDILSDLIPYGVSRGTVSTQLTGSIGKGMSLFGNTTEILRELSNNNFFIDNGKGNVLLANDAIGGNQVLINAQTGLLGTPLKEQQLLTLEMLFEPRLVIGSVVNLQSSTAAGIFNGLHKVLGFTHRGTISGAVSGNATTTLTLDGGVFNGAGL